MNLQFIGRKKELEYLNKSYKENSFSFIPLYGRRRVGKTELIKEFIKDKPHIYYMADKGKEIDQLRQIKEVIAEQFKDESLRNYGKFSNWNDVFRYLADKKEKLVIAIDEFTYLIETNKAVPSIFQKIIDQYLIDSSIMLILCSSSISMMEEGVLSYKSPLYGRRTGQIMLEPFKFNEIKGFLKSYNARSLIAAYGIFGGIPLYLLKMSDDISIIENIKKLFLDKNELLYIEAELMLKEELREPNMYFSILRAMSLGKTRPNEIATEIGSERTTITKYIETLERLRIVRKDVPITEKNIEKSRKGLYIISDNYFRFWFRFIFPYRSYIEEGRIKEVADKIKAELNQYLGFVFEDVCLAYLKDKGWQKAGRWWNKDKEIDIIGLDKDKILFGECKWKDNVDALHELQILKKKSKDVQHNLKKQEFMLFARSFKNKADAAQVELSLLTGKD